MESAISLISVCLHTATWRLLRVPPSPGATAHMAVPQHGMEAHKSWMSLETVAASCMDQISMLTEWGRRACSTCYVQSVHWQCSYTCALRSRFMLAVRLLQCRTTRSGKGFVSQKLMPARQSAQNVRSSYHLAVVNRQNKLSRLEVHLEKFHKEQSVSYSAKLNAGKAEPAAKKMKLDEQVSATPTLVQLSIPLFPFCFRFRPKVTGNFRFRSKIIFHFRRWTLAYG